MLQMQAVVPRSVLIFYPIVLIFLMAGDRFAYRIWKEHRLYSPLRRARRAGARDRRGRGRRAPHPRLRAEPAVARGRARRRRSGEARAAAARRERAGPDLEPAGVGEEIRRAPGDRRAALGRAPRAPARRGDLRRCGHRSAHRAFVRRSDERALGADDDPHDRARRPAGPRSGRARQRGAGRMARQSRRDGHRRGRLDRRRALPAHRPLPSGEARAVRPVGGRRSTGSRPRSPTAFRSCRWRRSWATSSTRRWSSRCSPASGRASSSMRAPTSTCR